MADTRESRACATEKKYVLDAATGAQVREWARARLEADPYGSGPDGDEYLTSSLYFDNDRHDVFHRRGSFGRAKFRIRRYSGADYVFIERKLRRPKLLVKRRTQVDLGTIGLIERGEVRRDSPAWWFYERLQMRRLAPSCLLSYHRTARAIATPNGLARLTVDDGIQVVQADGFLLPAVRSLGESILPGQVILELKYRGVLPQAFQDLIRTFSLLGQTASKYRLGMMALGHQLSDSDPREPAELVVTVK
jgi:hypothetical protein